MDDLRGMQVMNDVQYLAGEMHYETFVHNLRVCERSFRLEFCHSLSDVMNVTYLGGILADAVVDIK